MLARAKNSSVEGVADSGRASCQGWEGALAQSRRISRMSGNRRRIAVSIRGNVPSTLSACLNVDGESEAGKISKSARWWLE